jgi:hypothetical protein
VLKSTEFYDASLATFTVAGALNTGRTGHTATLLNDGTVLLVGGTSTGASVDALAGAEIFDQRQAMMERGRGRGRGCYSHTATLLSNGKVLIAGGYNSSGIASTADSTICHAAI